MKIVINKQELEEHVVDLLRKIPNNKLLLDHYLDGAIEAEADAICDGENVYMKTQNFPDAQLLFPESISPLLPGQGILSSVVFSSFFRLRFWREVSRKGFSKVAKIAKVFFWNGFD